MGYNIGDIIDIPHYGVVRVIDAQVINPTYLSRSYWRYSLEMITDPKGFEVYKSVKFRQRCLIDGLKVLDTTPIPKRKWIAYKKDKM
jgi:hypothetical protein